MRLLVLSGVKPTGILPKWASLFPEDIQWGFERLGWQVKSFVAKDVEDFVQCLEGYMPDLVLTLGSPTLYNDKVLKYIGNRQENCGYKYVHWDTDGIIWVSYELPLIEMSKPDLTFTVCPEMLDLLTSKGIKARRLDYGFNPKRHFKGEKMEQYQNMITLVARYYDTNAISEHPRSKSISTLAESLLNSGHNVDVWGNRQLINYSAVKNQMGGQYIFHGELDYMKTREVYSNCLVNLVVQNSPYYLTKRTYEIMASGGFAISYDTPEIRKVFVPDKEIVLSSSKEETISKFEYYRTHQKEREEIICNGLKVIENHSYQVRAQTIVNEHRDEIVLGK